MAITFSTDNFQLAMIAYSATNEFLIVVEMTSSTFETVIYQTGTQTDVVRTLGLLDIGYDKYFIVGAQQIRKVFGPENGLGGGAVYSSVDFTAPVIKCAIETSTAIFALI